MNIIDNIIMREVIIEDADKIYKAICSHREYLQVWLPFAATMQSVKDERDFLRSVLSVPREKRDFIYIIEEEENICGLIGYHYTDTDNHRTEIGYWLLPEYQHRGIITLCVRHLCHLAVKNRNINRIQIRCAVGNAASNAIPKRLGFHFEGTEREGELLASGKYTDIHIYSILKKEIEQWK